jgi:hypothetical protein
MVGQATAALKQKHPHFSHSIMSSKKPMVLIAPEVLQRVQNDVDKDLEFKKVSLYVAILTLETP